MIPNVDLKGFLLRWCLWQETIGNHLCLLEPLHPHFSPQPKIKTQNRTNFVILGILGLHFEGKHLLFCSQIDPLISHSLNEKNYILHQLHHSRRTYHNEFHLESDSTAVLTQKREQLLIAASHESLAAVLIQRSHEHNIDHIWSYHIVVKLLVFW